jgi:hypothetical protein
MNARIKEHIVARFPFYPATRKSSDAYQDCVTRWGPMIYQTWVQRLGVLCDPQEPKRYLIRLPGGHYAQPRSEVDWQHHVAGKTPKVKIKGMTLAEEIKLANNHYVKKLAPTNPFS